MEKQPPLYQIVDWDKNFENSKSRQRARCGFVCFPNRQGGMGLAAVLSEEDGWRIYGVWCLLIQLCSRHSDRQGWLTHNGKEDGPRIVAAEIARNYRGRTVHVYRMLQVMSRPDVGWLKLVEGEPEYSQKCEEKTVADGHSVTADGQSVTADGQSVTADGQSVTATEDVEDEQSNLGVHSLTADGHSVTADGHSLTADGHSVTQERKKEGNRANKTTTTTTPLLSQFSQKRERAKEGIGEDEAKAWLNEIFGDGMPWTYEEMLLLSQILPIPFAVHRLLDWAYKLPRDHPIHELTKLRQKRVSLLRDFGGEADKIRMMRKQMGYDELVPKKNGANPGDG